MTGEKRFPAPDIRPDLKVLLIVEGQAPIFRRLRGRPGTDLIRGDDALGHVDADLHRESSIGEYDSACIAAQPENLISGVRYGVANILVPPLQGGRERSRREVTWVFRGDTRRPLHTNVEIETGNDFAAERPTPG